jgi:glycosyltransferase involved in cell wall biosynthesis
MMPRFTALIPFSIYVALDNHVTCPYMRLDPGVDLAEFERISPIAIDGRTKVLMYSGTLNEANGFRLLLDAFSRVEDPSIQLWVTGKGSMQDTVKKSERADTRIHYWGFVERQELLNLMTESLVLINPRPPSYPENRYNFPSKLIEYMATGRPVISTATADLELEYGEFVFLTREDPDALAQIIDQVFDMPRMQLRSRGERGRQHILESKSWGPLSAKVAGFLESILSIGSAHS